ncbi:hypothetical protein AG1IA_05791 [Rhizoctonia solani AG-1 IA]|uniref:Uncharacterized protein n=1 Tax=Thanatephorus cucumeris (strain AG1-IA) TaxID=983506 RepID=L8WV10_THACA|nr:hypothetical protein AG1IA_05791 [Rhizoctonia solani AG-1 IA]
MTIEVVEAKCGNKAGEERSALGELGLEVLEMTARLECLSVSVLLLALDSRRLACTAVGMLRVALQRCPH